MFSGYLVTVTCSVISRGLLRNSLFICAKVISYLGVSVSV